MRVLKKKRSTEEVRRRKGIDSFIKGVGKSAVEYGKGRIRDYPKEVAAGWMQLGKRTSTEKLTMQDALKEVSNLSPIAEVVGGLSVTPIQALKQLGQSAAKLPRVPYLSGSSRKAVVPIRVRRMAATIRQTPKEVLEPLTGIKYTDRLPKGTIARNVRIGQKGGESKIQFSPRARPKDWIHETVHSTAYTKKGEKDLVGYYSTVLEEASNIATKRAANLNISKGTKRKFYKDEPVEIHARAVADELSSAPGKVSQKEFNQVFTNEAKKVLREVKERAPNLYKKTLIDVAKGFKKRAAQTKRVKKGKLPDTFDEWLEGVKMDDLDTFASKAVRNPESKATGKVIKIVRRPGKKGRLKKTPGQIAREIQDLAEKDGPPSYLRRKAD